MQGFITLNNPYSLSNIAFFVLNIFRMSLEVPDVVNAFSVLAKEDTSHGFPVWRPLERNSDWALYNINSEAWF